MLSKKTMRYLIAASLIFGLQAHAVVTTITVNTIADEDGGNSSACSLREAIASVNTKTMVGGCAAGSRIGKNLIQLDAGTYSLTRGELKIDATVTIVGKDTQRPDEVNPRTGQKPNRLRPDAVGSATIIRASPGSLVPAVAASRIFNASTDVALVDLVLQGNYPNSTAGTAQTNIANEILTSNELVLAGVPGNGGIIYAAGSVSLDNVIISNGFVYGAGTTYSGGAIYLSGDESGITLSDVTFRNNRASGAGGAIAMTCLSNGRLAVHSASMNKALFERNMADAGAGAVEVCGSVALSMTASTLSANRSLPFVPVTGPSQAKGAISYNQTLSGEGSVLLSFVTAAEHALGRVLSLSDLSSVSLNHSVLIGNTAGNCYLGVAPSTSPTGDYNATEPGDTSCDTLLSSAASNGNQDITRAFAAELKPLADRGGLVNGYLPSSGASSALIDKGGNFDDCRAVDQRGFVRTNGTACDIGALERLQVTVNDDLAENTPNTDRLVIVDVLANDSFGETDFGPNKYAEPAVVLTTNPNNQCKWINSTNTDYPDHPEYKNHLVVKSIPSVIVPPATVVAPPGTPTGTLPIQCEYRVNVIENDGTPPPTPPALPPSVTSAQEGTVSATVKNVAPNALNDVYVRPVGISSITINPLSNDDDDGDGVYGKPAQWAAFPIYISTTNMPQLGNIQGTKGRCADYTATNPKLCYAAPITYVANNSVAPFTDSFSYSVFDKDGKASVEAVVTINTDAPNPDNGETGGSLDLLGGLILALLGLRRTRKL